MKVCEEKRGEEEWRRQHSWFPLDKMAGIIREGARQQETFLLSFVLHLVRSPSWGHIMIPSPQRIGTLLDDPFLTHQSSSPSLPVGTRAHKLWARFITPRGDNSSGRGKYNFGWHQLKPRALLALNSPTFGEGFANGLKWITVMMVIMQEVLVGVDDLLEGPVTSPSVFGIFCVLYVSFYMLLINTWQNTSTRMMMFQFLGSNHSVA